MVTIIVPTYNEEKNILKFQSMIDNLVGDFEVIFSDGYSTDNTYNIIRYPKIQQTRYRANQMNIAVKYAKGEYLWFLHIDSIIDDNSVNEIENSKEDVGCFTLKFDSEKWQMKMVAFNSNLRVKYRNIAFGDQGIFIKRELFEKIGGYKSIPIMEDYQLSIDIKKLGKKIHLSKLPIITSARRFEKNGIFKTIINMQKLQYRYRCGYDINKIYSDYK